ncbi:4350_t:CDS:10 [Acaulospora morrowiae]|uniref:4350_t:CDS:1 n=1 Tax=Acaulospora morrowiae TaxID=94023 RepID=A0A9N8W5N3_9GLOM|nr:4350_t:CDS:10 [Acaulospora morrowiae]
MVISAIHLHADQFLSSQMSRSNLFSYSGHFGCFRDSILNNGKSQLPPSNLYKKFHFTGRLDGIKEARNGSSLIDFGRIPLRRYSEIESSSVASRSITVSITKSKPQHLVERSLQMLEMLSPDYEATTFRYVFDSKEYQATVRSDGHKSFFGWSWLRRHSYDPKFMDTQQIWNRKILWNAEIKDCPPAVQYEDVMQTSEGLADWLKKINEYGFCFVNGVPPSVKETEELARRICFIRETHYGKFWDFTANLEHGDTAYTNLKLKAHTDNTYFTEPSGLQMFHLIEFDGKGGESLLVDGFWVARQLKMKSPVSYHTLSTVPIPAHSAGDSNTLVQPTPVAHPILNHDPLDHSLYQIRYNNDDRSTMDHLSSGQVLEFYEALKKWDDELSDKENEYWFQLRPGRVLIFDNWRVLHGRAAFEGNRRLIGAYLNWDDYRSKLKVLHLDRDEILESL